jgi:hypothetical protein
MNPEFKQNEYASYQDEYIMPPMVASPTLMAAHINYPMDDVGKLFGI